MVTVLIEIYKSPHLLVLFYQMSIIAPDIDILYEYTLKCPQARDICVIVTIENIKYHSNEMEISRLAVWYLA